MKVLLTGATGFLGGRLAASLAARGHELTCLVRRPQAARELPAGSKLVVGDLTDRELLTAAVRGVESCVHAAAMVKRWAKDRASFDRVNVEGLRAVLDAARDAKLQHVVYVSSFFALGPTDGQVGDEAHQHDAEPRNDYERTKWLADQVARGYQSQALPLTIVYPGVIYGIGRITDGNIMAQAIRDLLLGKLPGTIGPGDRRWCLAEVEDVAGAITHLLEAERGGARYLLGGENVTVREALQIAAQAVGIEPPRRQIPYPIAKALGKVLRWRAELFGIEPFLTDEEVEIYRHEWAYSSNRAIQSFGYRITPAQQGITNLTHWLARELGR